MSRILMVIFGLLKVSSFAFAQSNTLSPYSIYGLGDTPYSSLTAQAGLSHTNLAFLSTQNINVNNPAALTYLNKPTFNFDVRNELLALNSSGQRQTNNLFSIENFSFAFPLIADSKKKRQSAFAFGIKPYSRQGYNVTAVQTIPEVGEVEYRFIGEGGINAAFFGVGFDLLADSGRVNVLSIGAVGSYVFGSIYRNRITTIANSQIGPMSGIFREQENQISAADARVGVLYTRKILWNAGKDDQRIGSFSIGGFYLPSFNFSSNNQSFTYSFAGDYLNPVFLDSIDLIESNLPLVAPSSFGVGIGFTYENKWNVGVDFTRTAWSALEIDGVNSGLNDESRFAAGLEYIPDPTSYKQLSKIIRYRAGLSYEQTRLQLNGVQPTRFGLSAGLGIPLIASRSTSIFNIGIEYARRGASSLPVIENYVNLHLGLTITPNQFDRWFVKRKYD